MIVDNSQNLRGSLVSVRLICPHSKKKTFAKAEELGLIVKISTEPPNEWAGWNFYLEVFINSKIVIFGVMYHSDTYWHNGDWWEIENFQQ